MGVGIAYSRAHTEVWESVSPTKGTTLTYGTPYPQLQGPHHNMGVGMPNASEHTKVWESVFPKKGTTQKRGSPYPMPKQGI